MEKMMYPKHNRRSTALTALTLAVLPLAATLIPLATPAAQAASTLQCRTASPVFAVLPDGSLRLYNHEEPEQGLDSWTGWSHIGNGWSPLTRTGPDGRLYDIVDGELRRYRWTGSEWERPGGGWYDVIATGWTGWDSPAFRNRLTVDSRGDFYALLANGDLQWEHFDEATRTWSRRVLEQGDPNRYDLIVAAGDGVLFVRDPHRDNGTLYRYEYHAPSHRWVQRKHPTGNGWNMHRALFSPGAGIVYGQQDNDRGDLWWYRYDDSLGDFAFGGRKHISWGWSRDWRVGATTDACALPDAPAPVRPAVPARHDAATTALPGTDGRMNYFYTNSQGSLVHARQRRADDPLLIDYQSFPDHHGFTGTPGAAVRADGRVEVIANSSDDADARGKLQQVANGVWAPGAQQHGGWLLGDPTLVTTSVGTSALGVDADGVLWHRPQLRDRDRYLPWRALPATGLTTDLTALPAPDPDRAVLDLAARFTDGSTRVARLVDGELGPWRALGAGLGEPALVRHQNGDLQVFTRGQDGRVRTQRENAGAFPGTWSTVGDLVTTGSPTAVATTRGLVEVAARGVDGLVHVTGQSVPAGPFREWSVRTFDDAATDPASAALPDGSWVFTWRDAQNTIYSYTGSYPDPAARAATAGPPSTTAAYRGGPARP
ncbi:tachylectin-related carbohydrate-binding protein [Actinosynnema pretiosum]|nr:tachylectin-related carbohydrate-binding protein [Actinosynnema pretiosum]